MSHFSHHTADRVVRIPVNGVELVGEIFLPDSPTGMVLFVHGSGSNRNSPRNRKLSEALNDEGLATVLFDLLTPLEAAEDRWRGHLSFDIPLLGSRLAGVMDWLENSPLTRDLGVGLFGADTGAAAALWVAADRPLEVQAVVCRGGRPDLVSDQLAHVVAPTRLIVGEKDEPVVAWNRDAFSRLSGEHDFQVVAGASHLFPEPYRLEEVGRLSTEWFARYLQRQRPSSHFPAAGT